MTSLRWILTINVLLAQAAVVPTMVAAQEQPPELEAAASFEEGLESYLEGNYDDALVAFMDASATGKTSGELLYNIGNTYFRLNDLGNAILFYERARLLMPNDELLDHSIRIARRKTENRLARVPIPIWSKYWLAIQARVGPGWMFFIGLCFYFTAVVFLAVRIWSNSRNDWLRRGFALSLLAAIPLLLGAFWASVDQDGKTAAVVLDTRVELRESPSGVGEVTTTAFEGLVVDIVDVSENWRLVRLPDGSTGWLEDSSIEEV